MRAKYRGIVGVIGPPTSAGFATVRMSPGNLTAVILTKRITGADLMARAA
jgi:hypothetical protein